MPRQTIYKDSGECRYTFKADVQLVKKLRIKAAQLGKPYWLFISEALEHYFVFLENKDRAANDNATSVDAA